MSRFSLTGAEIQAAIDDLSAKNVEFKNRVSELLTLQQELNGQWQGEANVAFGTAFSNDKGQWDNFAQLVDQYIEALRSIKQQYDAAERTNVDTASNRSSLG